MNASTIARPPPCTSGVRGGARSHALRGHMPSQIDSEFFWDFTVDFWLCIKNRHIIILIQMQIWKVYLK